MKNTIRHICATWSPRYVIRGCKVQNIKNMVIFVVIFILFGCTNKKGSLSSYTTSEKKVTTIITTVTSITDPNTEDYYYIEGTTSENLKKLLTEDCWEKKDLYLYRLWDPGLDNLKPEEDDGFWLNLETKEYYHYMKKNEEVLGLYIYNWKEDIGYAYSVNNELIKSLEFKGKTYKNNELSDSTEEFLNWLKESFISQLNIEN